MRTVTMTATRLGSPDGIAVHTYEAGRSYDLPEGLADNFIGQGAATEAVKPAEESAAEPATETAEDAPKKRRRG